jgi:diguanylate cyclase (GGDEF)-like protein
MNHVKKNSLLIVDDDTLNIMMLSQILQGEYDIRASSKGATAVKIAEKFLPDLIILDIMMPEMDGYQVFAALKNLDKTANIPVIFITGLDNRQDEKKGLELGAVDYISKPFDDMVVRLRVNNQIHIINQMRTIERLSLTDQLTGIPNRRSFDSRLLVEWGRTVWEDIPLSILMLDVDHFKNYNDTYGHNVGDQALCLVARVLVHSLKRVTDFAARWGGEEFVAVLPNTDSGGGLIVAERIREDIEASELPLSDGRTAKLTVSIGVNTYAPASSCSMEDFFFRADKALYKAKNSGRNRVCLYE